MNRSMLMGRLVRDPEIRYTENDDGELAIANFRLAVDRKYRNKGKDKATADFIDCTAFAHLAEFAEKYLYQGIRIIVSGELRNNNYVNRDGDKVYSMVVRLDDIEFAESKNASQRNEDSEESESSSDSKRDFRRGQTSKDREASTKNSSRGSSKGSNEGRTRNRSEPREDRNRSANSRERNRRQDPDEEFRDMEEYEEDYNFN